MDTKSYRAVTHPSIKPSWASQLFDTTFRTAFVAVVMLWAIQDIVLIMMDHHTFANSIICTNPTITAAGGRYASQHCSDHNDLSNYLLVRAWMAAIYEANSGKLALAGLAICFSRLI